MSDARYSHEGAMKLLRDVGGVTVMSYEEAIAVYLRARGILRDSARVWGDYISPVWRPGDDLIRFTLIQSSYGQPAGRTMAFDLDAAVEVIAKGWEQGGGK